LSDTDVRWRALGVQRLVNGATAGAPLPCEAIALRFRAQRAPTGVVPDVAARAADALARARVAAGAGPTGG
jgi:hypothetical protein